MNEGKDVVIYVDGEPIAETSACKLPKWNDTINNSEKWSVNINDTISSSKETAWEFYMRRGNRHYFRSEAGKLVITSPELKTMEAGYGERVTFIFESC